MQLITCTGALGLCTCLQAGTGVQVIVAVSRWSGRVQTALDWQLSCFLQQFRDNLYLNHFCCDCRKRIMKPDRLHVGEVSEVCTPPGF